MEKESGEREHLVFAQMAISFLSLNFVVCKNEAFYKKYGLQPLYHGSETGI